MEALKKRCATILALCSTIAPWPRVTRCVARGQRWPLRLFRPLSRRDGRGLTIFRRLPRRQATLVAQVRLTQAPECRGHDLNQVLLLDHLARFISREQQTLSVQQVFQAQAGRGQANRVVQSAADGIHRVRVASVKPVHLVSPVSRRAGLSGEKDCLHQLTTTCPRIALSRRYSTHYFALQL
ncbi:hypothetical protein D3C76_1240190 [compost metagenome]